jgi:phage terminase large subunit-like protein
MKHCRITPSAVTMCLEKHIHELSQRFVIKSLAYDALYARHLARQLQDEDAIHVVAFRQTMMAFSPPTTEFERLLIGGKVRHPRHPILSRQRGTCG